MITCLQRPPSNLVEEVHLIHLAGFPPVTIIGTSTGMSQSEKSVAEDERSPVIRGLFFLALSPLSMLFFHLLFRGHSQCF